MTLFHLWLFGREIVDRKDMTGREDLGTGGLGCLGNIIWFVLAGWWLHSAMFSLPASLRLRSSVFPSPGSI